ncbi:MAG: GntR family transcriptional regulator [Sphaerochaeta sp.]|nr:GntR family transcriptional regulator [Sphaerochaeta sp.]MDD4573130.1 GntR family transcriptional regulator [Sphaerochaeta sp.]
MPKIVFPVFLNRMMHDIDQNYHKDERYLSVREIASKFEVSIQTAQKGVKDLASRGILLPKRKSGIYVLQNNIFNTPLEGKQLIVITRIDNPLFYQPFLDGVIERTIDTGIATKLIINSHHDITSLSFGEYLVDLRADGIITLNFGSSSSLPFYHVIREKVDIVSDIIIDELPILPAVQTDNYKHAFSAGRTMLNSGISTFYVFGSYPVQNKRFIGFKDAVKAHAERIRYIQISEVDSMSIALGILNNITPDTGVFLCDYTAVHYIASLCSRFKIQFPEHNIIAYDGEHKEFQYPEIPAIPCVAPSFEEIGYELCNTMIHKWEQGTFPNPLHKKI